MKQIQGILIILFLLPLSVTLLPAEDYDDSNSEIGISAVIGAIGAAAALSVIDIPYSWIEKRAVRSQASHQNSKTAGRYTIPQNLEARFKVPPESNFNTKMQQNSKPIQKSSSIPQKSQNLFKRPKRAR